MNEELNRLAHLLNETLKSNEIIKRVHIFEDAMMNESEFINLSIKKQQAEDDYNAGIRLKLPIEDSQKILHQIKYQIDTLDVVVAYRKAYFEAKELLDIVANETFKNISSFLKINSIFGD